MQSGFRRRLAAALLLALSPALVAAAVPIVHPCPVDMPWLAGAEAGHHHHQGPASDGDRAPQAVCECVGCSIVPNAVVPTVAPAVVPMLTTTPAHVAWPVVPSTSPAAQHLDRLPDSTAPPLA